jgi:hypothetical protein
VAAVDMQDNASARHVQSVQYLLSKSGVLTAFEAIAVSASLE